MTDFASNAEPSPVPQGSIRVYPFGGLGEFGMNCLAIEQEDAILVVDCGAAFSRRDLGIELEHPDFSWIRSRAPRVLGVVLTHGHEDHVAGVPYLLSALDVPVWGSPYALAVLRERLRGQRDPAALRLFEVAPRRPFSVGPFEIEPVRVAHSIVEATALHIGTRAGAVLHTGDFNFDADPPDGEPTDSERLKELGDAGIGLLLSDSTNSDVEERRGSERDVGDALERVVTETPERAIVALFSSNVQRLISLARVARRTHKKLCLLGRGIEKHVRLATAAGWLDWPSELEVAVERAQAVPRHDLLVLAGGSQAESQSALRRLAAQSHPHLQLERGDTVVLSSRVIPGNERLVVEMVSDLLRQGVRVRQQRSEPELHTSGHAGRSEQRRMLELVRPRAFVPLHGSLHHLLRHAELARSLGVPAVEVVENGTPFEFDGTALTRLKPVTSSRVAVGVGGRAIGKAALEQRAKLSRGGVVVVSAALDRQGSAMGSVRVFFAGVPLDEGSQVASAVERAVVRALGEEPRASSPEDRVRLSVRRALEIECGYAPLVEVHLIRCSA